MVDKELENVYIYPNVAALRGGGDGRILQWFCSTLQRAGRSVRGERAHSAPVVAPCPLTRRHAAAAAACRAEQWLQCGHADQSDPSSTS